MEAETIPLPPPADLLATAEARLRRQRGFARPLSGRGARGLEAGLADARAALAGVVAPGALVRRVPGRVVQDHVVLDGLRLDQPRLAAELAAGAQPAVTLTTLGEDAEALRRALAGDALRLHLAAALAQQVLYAAARAAHAHWAGRHPGHRAVRLALRGGDGLWDAAAVARLLPLMGPAPLGVKAVEGGGVQPVHTLLGLTVLRPPPPATVE